MKNLKLINSLVVSLLISTSTVAFAESGGNSGGGGGDAVRSKDGWSLLDLSEKVSFEYFAPLKDPVANNFYVRAVYLLGEKCGTLIRPPSNFKQSGDGSEERNYDIDLSRIIGRAATGAKFQFVSEEAQQANKSLQLFSELIWAGTNTPLEEISDEGTARLFDEHSKQQVAIQRNGTVLIYLPIFNQMEARSKAALIVHEAILHAVLVTNPQHYATHGTELIRRLVRATFSPEAEQLPTSVFSSMCNLDGALFKGSSLPPISR